jgi:hypothetical protein
VPRHAKLFLLGALLGAPLAQADTVACHLSYGGETQVVEARPDTSPYTAPPVAIGSYFLFRIVFRSEPVDLAGIKLYTYADRNAGPVIIHQASYGYPLANAAIHGFSGMNSVYEPVRDGELHYWCELKAEAGK